MSSHLVLQRGGTLPWNMMHFDTMSWTYQHGLTMVLFHFIYEAIGTIYIISQSFAYIISIDNLLITTCSKNDIAALWSLRHIVSRPVVTSLLSLCMTMTMQMTMKLTLRCSNHKVYIVSYTVHIYYEEMNRSIACRDVL